MGMDATALSNLNDQQRAAATHGDGPLLIIAGAGTGKTATLAHRVAHLIKAGTKPDRILRLTCTDPPRTRIDSGPPPPPAAPAPRCSSASRRSCPARCPAARRRSRRAS